MPEAIRRDRLLALGRLLGGHHPEYMVLQLLARAATAADGVPELSNPDQHTADTLLGYAAERAQELG
jgi:hypothetical protein